MKEAFPVCKSNDKTPNDILNFITGCLNIIPEYRPTVQQLQDHKLFGGTWQYTNTKFDIWKNKGEVFFLILFLM